MEAKSLSIIVPVFNEELTIEQFYKEIDSVCRLISGKTVEIIFVNDGSSDNTKSKLDIISEKDYRVKILHLARNQGHQIALTAGMDFACGDIVITIDSDLQDPPQLIIEMINKIEKENFDIVHAHRLSRSGESFFKLATAKLFYFLLKLLSNKVTLNNCGDFRAFTSPVLKLIRSFRSPVRYLRGIFSDAGFRQCFIEYNRCARIAGNSKYSLRKMIKLATDAIFSFSSAPITFVYTLSISLWACSLIYFIWALIQHFIYHNTIPGWTSIIGLLFFFNGMILFCLSIIGEYIGKIFTINQNEPLYWLSDVRNIDIQSTVLFRQQSREMILNREILTYQNEKCSQIYSAQEDRIYTYEPYR